ncbi:MAG: alcohol dehydrogenase catalytic domain-containing protein [Chthonomonas sp.]|nr:alcohol dehydrogenase catalytic domain-containing protein [Chthonomonas sp.]
MKLAEYVVGGDVRIVDRAWPTLPKGGLLVKTEACGLCSGELMAWYLDRKAPHVLGHEVAGVVEQSDDSRFPVGSRVFTHHHAPCLKCDACKRGASVHCTQWKRTFLDPGGMSEYFAVSADGLNDALRVDGLRAVDAALIEPLACVVKSIRRSGSKGKNTAIIGAGALGLMHALLLPDAHLIERNRQRIAWARRQRLTVKEPQPDRYETVFVCPGTPEAVQLGFEILAPDGTLVLFAPMPPGEFLPFPQEQAYFKDARIVNSYSCGPEDTRAAFKILTNGGLRAEQVVSDFVMLERLPEAYQRMRDGEILKAMVVFD